MNNAGIAEGLCYLVADIGGTNARFACVSLDDAGTGDALLRCVDTCVCADFERPQDAVEAYLSRLHREHALKPVSACLAVAAAVHRDLITLTNNPWQFSRSELEKDLGIPVAVLNDFSAQAYCLLQLQEADLHWLQRPAGFAGPGAAATSARTIVGPGTGFGAATLTPAGEILESEPGHCSFAPVTPHELDLLRVLWRRYPRISVEHLLSGPGLANLYWANDCLRAEALGQGAEQDADSVPVAAQIVAAAQQGDALALQSVRDFTGILGSVSGDIALAMGSLGGFYLSGGMLEKMDTLFDQDLFMSRFLAKGPFGPWCAEVPVARLASQYPGLLGCAVYSRVQNLASVPAQRMLHASQP